MMCLRQVPGQNGRMSLAIIHSRAIAGLLAQPVRVEADLANGLPQLSIVGLPDTAVREARDRVRAAIVNSGFEFPQRRITINLAPADLPKDSGRFDLPMALGILAASGQLGAEYASRIGACEFLGELSLTGGLLPVRGAFALALGMLRDPTSKAQLVLPIGNRAEVSLSGSARIGFAATLRQLAACLISGQELDGPAAAPGDSVLRPDDPAEHLIWQAVEGQHPARRAALVAAAGQHNLLMFGPPGVGKSMIAGRMPAMLPDLSLEQACELAAVTSLNGAIDPQQWRRPPLRSPHHSTPARALIGGGHPVQPGEMSLAHHGLLFMDEFPEFARDALEALREPLETSEICVARVRDRVRLPADILLVAAMNPCPCGYFGTLHARRTCRCTPDRILRYRSRISGPLLDRFDLAIHLESDTGDAGSAKGEQQGQLSPALVPGDAESPAAMVRRVRQIALVRQSCTNARLDVDMLKEHATLDSRSEKLLQETARSKGWSMRARHRVQRVARTLADIGNSPHITWPHLAEAIELRRALDMV